MCQLRDYIPGDEKKVFKIVKNVLAEYGLSTNSKQTDADLNDIHSSYLFNGGVFRILQCDELIVGSYGLYPTTRHSCELRKMYILPQFKGRGLGKMMMEDALRLAKDRGFVEITLETNSSLKEALSLYKKYGFTEFNPIHLSDRCDLAMKRAI